MASDTGMDEDLLRIEIDINVTFLIILPASDLTMATLVTS